MLTLKAPIELITAHKSCWICQGTTPVSFVRARQSFDRDMQITVDEARVVQPRFLAEENVGPAKRFNPGLRIVRSDWIWTRRYWANHWLHCDALHGEFSLHTEPDSPFFGGQIPVDAVTVRLLDNGEYKADVNHAY